ncbi:hypothetical protein DSO57_1007755 [Entomophthora muscae]|uniref:Uncharacterized protein n=1 Tax=Entomophthora muscae TaxID=34485 RepID=A0ACC2UGE6_9FUNG|nr:hypothetical protein DSO57_1007755 [Entomophthora muscae]
MECAEVASKKIQAESHNISIFPVCHADLHLGDVLFFNIGGTIRERNSTTFSQVLSSANNPSVLFPHQKIAEMFTKMAFNALVKSQSPKDPQLPPCDSPVYKPITVLPRSENDVLYNCQNHRLNPPARFQPSGFVTRNPIIRSLKARLGSQLKLPNPTT